MKTKIYEIPGKMVSHYYPEEKIIIDSWTELNASFEDWKKTIYEIGILDFAPKNGVTTWITDTSRATGIFDNQIQDFRKDVSAAAMAKSGIKLFFTVLSSSALSTLSVRKTSKVYGGHGEMKSMAVSSLDEAFEIREKELSLK